MQHTHHSIHSMRTIHDLNAQGHRYADTSSHGNTVTVTYSAETEAEVAPAPVKEAIQLRPGDKAVA